MLLAVIKRRSVNKTFYSCRSSFDFCFVTSLLRRSVDQTFCSCESGTSVSVLVPPAPSRVVLRFLSLSVLCIGTPFRESGPPACMAKLIMLRHKVSPPPCCCEVAPRRG